MKEKKIRRDLILLTLAIPVFLFSALLYKYIILVYFNKYVFCIASDYIGYYCPGCGGTRAVFALIEGKILHAVWYHPVVPYTAFLYTGYLITNWLEWFGCRFVKGWKFHNWYIYVGLLLLAVNFIFKNILRLRFGIMME